MRDPDDLWYIRLPDGRVVRAKTTRALRYHIESGRVPWNSWARRDVSEDWVTLDWIPELSDLGKERSRAKPIAVRAAHASTPAAAAIESPLPRPLGVRGLVDELLNTLEATFDQTKLLIGAAMGLFLGLGMVAAFLTRTLLDEPWMPWLIVGSWVLVALLCMMGSVLLTRMTVLELARMGPARPREVRAGMLARTARLFLAQLLTSGVLMGLLFLVPWLREGFQGEGATALPDGLAALLAAAGLILELSCFPILALSLLLAPILVVEKAGALGAVAHWWRVLRVHLGRFLIYEALAMTMALIVTLPFLAPLAFAAWHSVPDANLPALVRTGLILLLTGLALTPLLTFLIIANVHIYLSVQYEFFHSARRKGREAGADSI